ncbi:hypothetical protein [Bosea sp. (in: a-proteobacteria)]|uniref:hypothetical protein n=1 Tax=Bosea sp. (in: a-proteobacteria) TaxID=1871050 RepID=UPI002FC85F93
MSEIVIMFVILPSVLFFGGYLLFFRNNSSPETWAARILGCIILVPIILLGWFLSLFSSGGIVRGDEGLYVYLVFTFAGIVYHYERVLSLIAIASFYAIFAYVKLKA